MKQIEEMKALSLWQPWASLMQIGAKTVETRGWKTNYRGPLLICSTKGGLSKKELKKVFTTFSFLEALYPLVKDECPSQSSTDTIRDAIIRKLPFGKALCIVDLVDVVPMKSLPNSEYWLTTQELRFGDYSLGRYAWITQNLQRIEPIDVTGLQGLFKVPKEFQENIVPIADEANPTRL